MGSNTCATFPWAKNVSTFRVQYRIRCFEGEEISEKLRWICLEQSVELPEEVVPAEILNSVVGKVHHTEKLEEQCYHASIDWPLKNIGEDPSQFLNVLYGNISLKKGIRVHSVEWDKLFPILKGPAFGIKGMRERMGVWDRPLACGVLKPMGLRPEALAEQARSFSLGGIDMIKDDHGLADQSYATFEERCSVVVAAVKQANEQSGHNTLYFPHVTTGGTGLMDRCRKAKALGADGVLIIPELCGYASMHDVARSDLNLPIISHPALSGSRVIDPDHGFLPSFLYGALCRAFGADFTVYPNTSGRFSFTESECLDLNERARSPKLPFKRSFPTPGGGMERERIRHWAKRYGKDTVFLLGASMLKHPKGLEEASREVRQLLEESIS